MLNKMLIQLLHLTIIFGSVGLFAEPIFHLKNNSPEAIQIDVLQDGKSLMGLKSIASNKDLSLEKEFTPTKGITLELYFCPTSTWCKTNSPKKLATDIKSSGKTVYIKFDG